MKTNHTPGPWHSSTLRYKSDYELIYDKSDRIICQMYDRFEDNFTNYEANAKLIIAAPELLEACLTAKAMYEAQGINETCRIGGAQYKQLLGAIKKATE